MSSVYSAHKWHNNEWPRLAWSTWPSSRTFVQLLAPGLLTEPVSLWGVLWSWPCRLGGVPLMWTEDREDQTGEVCALEDLLLATLIKIKVLTFQECSALIRNSSVIEAQGSKMNIGFGSPQWSWVIFIYIGHCSTSTEINPEKWDWASIISSVS